MKIISEKNEKTRFANEETLRMKIGKIVRKQRERETVATGYERGSEGRKRVNKLAGTHAKLYTHIGCPKKRCLFAFLALSKLSRTKFFLQ